MKGSVRQGEVDAELNTLIGVYKNWLISCGCSPSPLEAEGLDSNSMGQQGKKSHSKLSSSFLKNTVQDIGRHGQLQLQVKFTC